MKNIFAAITLMASSACFADEQWDNADKAQFVGLTAVRAIDFAQTMNIARNPDKFHEETNVLLGDHPSPTKVAVFFVASHALIWLAADYMSPKARKIFLTGGIVIEAGFVGRNASLGIKARF